MKIPDKGNILFGSNGFEVKSPEKGKVKSPEKGMPRKTSNSSEKPVNKFGTTLDFTIHTNEAKSGLYQKKYDKNPMDSSKLKISVAEPHLYEEYRARNWFQNNLHM
jgi:hypothetical protein